MSKITASFLLGLFFASGVFGGPVHAQPIHSSGSSSVSDAAPHRETEEERLSKVKQRARWRPVYDRRSGAFLGWARPQPAPQVESDFISQESQPTAGLPATADAPTPYFYDGDTGYSGYGAYGGYGNYFFPSGYGYSAGHRHHRSNGPGGGRNPGASAPTGFSSAGAVAQPGFRGGFVGAGAGGPRASFQSGFGGGSTGGARASFQHSGGGRASFQGGSSGGGFHSGGGGFHGGGSRGGGGHGGHR